MSNRYAHSIIRHKEFYNCLEIRLLVQIIMQIESIKEALNKSSFFQRFFLLGDFNDHINFSFRNIIKGKS